MPYGSDPIQAAPDPPPGSVGLPEWAGGAQKKRGGYGQDPIQQTDADKAGLPVLQDRIFGPGTAERALRYMASPMIGMEQLAGTLLPIPAIDPKTGKSVPRLQADMETERRNEEEIAKLRGGICLSLGYLFCHCH
jgi:hypothetical protein